MIKLSVEELKSFTKEELIYYLKSIEFYIPNRKTESIKYCILNKRYDDLSKAIDDALSEKVKLLQEYSETKNLDTMIEVAKLSKKIDDLFDKQRKIEKELWV